MTHLFISFWSKTLVQTDNFFHLAKLLEKYSGQSLNKESMLRLESNSIMIVVGEGDTFLDIPIPSSPWGKVTVSVSGYVCRLFNLTPSQIVHEVFLPAVIEYNGGALEYDLLRTSVTIDDVERPLGDYK